MIVLSTAVPATESVVVAPISVIPVEMISWLVHVAVPAGTTTVSPSTADEIAAVTSEYDRLATVIVAALSSTSAARKTLTKTAPKQGKDANRHAREIITRCVMI